ncbi:MAG: molecular chaperone HtpG [Rhodospirillaceae bacterium]|nr:molecular chaperone HtpG [Rhodospirillaceae bacterium]
MSEEQMTFQAEVSRLLEIVAKSLYSQKEVFLRELISNASDACDRLRYAAIAEPDLLAGDGEFKITLSVDKGARTLTVADNGIGMGREELIENLGTIARSGTLGFLDSLTGDNRQDINLIGQFGVGFYSAFMVAKQVEVLTRRAGGDAGWRWVSDGHGSYTIGEADVPLRGTRVVVHLADGEDEFLDPQRLRHIVKTHSDHIAIPVILAPPAGEDGEPETLNRASALWTRPKSEVSDSDYTEFYRHVAHAFDEPLLTVHYRAEGVIEYSALLFVPTRRPFDLFHPDRKHHVKLYVRRVFVSDEAEGLVPSYLRFLRGVVDSQDLPLNVSREMLQGSPLVAKIRQGITRRVLADLKKKAADDADGYAEFWDAFGAVVKEGLYEDTDQREALLPLVRFRTTAAEGWVALDDYVARMRPGQDAIYYVSADTEQAARQSPQIEGFRAKGVEVLLLTDPVDEFWLPAVGRFQEKPFKSVTRGGADLGSIAPPEGAEPEPEKPEPAGIDGLIARFKLALGDAVKDVRVSHRLTDSPVCLVADDSDLDMHLERLLRQHNQLDKAAPRILEVNPNHPLVVRLASGAAATSADGATAGRVEDIAHLLLDQARILEGEAIPDPAGYARRLSGLLAQVV